MRLAYGQSDEAQIRTLLQKYATSINNADVNLASEIWSHDSDVIFVHPLGTDRGFDQIAADIYTKVMGGMFSKRELILHEPDIHIYGGSGWCEMNWTFHAIRKDGIPITTEGRETQIYHKEKGTWRIVLVHYSGLPANPPPAN